MVTVAARLIIVMAVIDKVCSLGIKKNYWAVFRASLAPALCLNNTIPVLESVIPSHSRELHDRLSSYSTVISPTPEMSIFIFATISSSMKMEEKNWVFLGAVFLLVLLAFQHEIKVCPASIFLAKQSLVQFGTGLRGLPVLTHNIILLSSDSGEILGVKSDHNRPVTNWL